MKKILISITFILLLSSCSLLEKKEEIKKQEIKEIEVIDELSEKERGIKEAEEKKQKIDTIKKKLSIKGLILKGDIHFRNKDYTSALIKYLQIHREIPYDQSIINNLGEVYNNLKKFKQSYSYFSKIKDYKKLDHDLVVKTLFSSVPLTDENIDYIIEELDTLGLEEQQLFYYKNSIRCTQDFSNCKQKFQEYFNKEIENGSGKVLREITFTELNDIKVALKNYENFQIDDLSYKGALISGVFFVNELYPVAIKTSKEILKEKKDYKNLLKIVSKSYYELGNYIEAKIYIIKYNKLVEDDYEASYFLGRIYEKLHEYILSTIHFKKALKIGYEDELEINRRILLNYYELGEIEKMLIMFKKIIDENTDEINKNDYELAIYYHILNEKIKEAKEITNKALIKYPNVEVYYGYMGWILMEEDNDESYEEVNKYINKGLELNKKSPMINLVKGKFEMKKSNLDKAFIYFKKTISLDTEGEFGKIAKDELEKIQINK